MCIVQIISLADAHGNCGRFYGPSWSGNENCPKFSVDLGLTSVVSFHRPSSYTVRWKSTFCAIIKLLKFIGFIADLIWSIIAFHSLVFRWTLIEYMTLLCGFGIENWFVWMCSKKSLVVTTLFIILMPHEEPLAISYFSLYISLHIQTSNIWFIQTDPTAFPRSIKKKQNWYYSLRFIFQWDNHRNTWCKRHAHAHATTNVVNHFLIRFFFPGI